MFSKFISYYRAYRQDINEVLLLIPIFSLYTLVNQYFITVVETEGPSMQPTIKDSNIVLVDRVFYKLRGIQKGDIIVATSPIDPKTQVCKRVLTLPGDVRVIPTPFGTESFRLPQNHVWIEGDNKSNSFDSRMHGPLPMQLIQGKVFLSLYPFKFFSSYEDTERRDAL